MGFDIKGSIDVVATNVKNAGEEVYSKTGKAAEAVSSKAKEVGSVVYDKTGDVAEAAVSKVKDMGDVISDKSKETFEHATDKTKEIGENVHQKTNEFNKKYVSKVVPNCGKYGNQAKFAAELVPGVAEYNAVVEGDWKKFAITAAIDVAFVAATAATIAAGGSGGTAIKGAEVGVIGLEKAGEDIAAKAVVKTATKEVAKVTTKEIVETSVKEVTEVGIKEVAEVGVKEIAEVGVKEVAETSMKEVVETSVKEISETGVKEVVENGEKKAIQVVKNKLDGIAREEIAEKELVEKFGEENVIREAYIRDSAGNIIKDTVDGTARRIDFVVKESKEGVNKIIKAIEVTSETADKTLQKAKEDRILEQAVKSGGAFIKDKFGELLELDVPIELRRFK